MVSLVLNLQTEVLRHDARVSDVLRTAKAVCVKLRIDEFRDWIDNELNGYRSPSEVPDYRRRKIQLKVLNPVRGWVSAIIPDKETEDLITTFNILQSVGSLENLVSRRSSTEGPVMVPLSGLHQQVLSRLFDDIELEFSLHIDVSHIVGILDSVRNKILDWSLELEKSGIIGENMSFTKAEQNAAKDMGPSIFHIHSVGFIGNVNSSNVAQNGSTINSHLNLDEVRDFVKQAKECIADLDNDKRSIVIGKINHVESELEKNKPNVGLIRELLNSIKSALEDATGNLIANGIAGLINRIIG